MTHTVRRTILTAVLLIMGLPASAAATWSVIVIDKRTGSIGVAGASCTSDVHGIMALAPGTGAFVAQATGHPAAMREAIRLLRAGIAPDSILRALSAPALDSARHDRPARMPAATRVAALSEPLRRFSSSPGPETIRTGRI